MVITQSKKNMKYTLVLLTNLLSNVVSEDSENKSSTNNTLEGRIIPGLDASIETYSYAALLRFKITSPHLCGAFLIMTQIVLTAATCTEEFYIKEGIITAYLGHDKPKYATVVRRVINVRTHPKYNFNKKINNLAIMFLETPVVFGMTVKKIVLPARDGFNFEKITAYGVGWGRQDMNTKVSDYMDRKLIGTKQRMLGLDDCRRKTGAVISGIFTVCGVPLAGQFYKDDAGAGLVFKEKDYMFLGAVLSHVINAVAVYTLVEAEWIKKQAVEMHKQSCNVKYYE